MSARPVSVVALVSVVAACACARDRAPAGPQGPHDPEAALDAGAAPPTAVDAVAAPVACTTPACRVAELERRCNEHDRQACNNLGSTYASGRDVPRDLDRARALWSQGCEEAYGTACFNLGNLDWEHDRAAWARNVARACELEQGVACVRLGEAYAGGALGAIDRARAGQLFDRACELGRASGCELSCQLAGKRYVDGNCV